MNAAIEAGKAIEKAKKLKAQCDAAVERSTAKHVDTLAAKLAALESSLSTEALAIYRGQVGK